jgi:membrane protein required for colicin V production
MNLVDVFMLLLLVGSLAVGFFNGTIRLVIVLIAFYVSIILASLYFELLGAFFRQRFRTTLEVGQITAFGLVLMVAFIVLAAAGLYTFRYAKVPQSLDFVDRIVGTLFGLVFGAFLIGMFASLLIALFVANNPGALLTWPLMRSLQQGVRESFLVTFFANQILPLIYSAVRPFLPNAADIIFRVRGYSDRITNPRNTRISQGSGTARPLYIVLGLA